MALELPHYRPSHNPYWQKLRELSMPDGRQPGLPVVLLDQETENYRGKWRTKFEKQTGKKNSKLHAEIGCNGGHVLIEKAKQAPKEIFIGIDWKFKQIYNAALKIQKLDLKNIVFLRANALRFNYLFNEKEVDTLSVYFPDPWPKRAQQKNRLLSSEWLAWAESRTYDFLEIKTDHPDYFNSIVQEVFLSGCWHFLEFSRDTHKNNPNAIKLDLPEVSVFERLFIREKKPIQRMVLKPF